MSFQTYMPAGTFNTPDGGRANLFINKTGADSVKGTVVSVSDTTDFGVRLIAVNDASPIGVVYNSGVPDGGYVWVVGEGLADVLFIGSATRGHIARGFLTLDAGYEAGKALSEAYPSAPLAADKHFYEIGHVVQSHDGAGLARVKLHFL